MISAVLDTNVLASGTISYSTPPGQILNAWRNGKFELLSAKASYFITGDGSLLRRVGPIYKGVTFLSPGDFVKILKGRINEN
ncbi:hypothetical protein HYT74_01835 [Candidatus Daviesbacteria bacterium]|nr:hypothetical protein [Candidatus Daviesbacteria bacterium]